MTRAIAIIPARAGSKGVPGKNVRPLAGHPVIAYSIVAGLAAGELDGVMVSTDSPEIAALGKKYGADVPFLRPKELAQDASPDRAYIEHALDWLAGHGGEPDYLVILRPTTPIRDPALIEEAIRSIRSRADATGLRSVHPLAEPPQKMMGIDGGWLVGLFPHDPRPEYYNLPRQAFPPAYHPNGYVDIVTARQVRGSREGVFGPRVLGLVTPVSVELDGAEDFDRIEFSVARERPILLDRMPTPIPS
jgi:CMP-N,N'-diacetyllegionaminic acid synthase